MPTFESVDPRLGPAYFARYSRALGTCLRNFPSPTRIPVPAGVAPSTFLARFRDAILGYRLHRWPTTDFSDDLFTSLDGKFALRPDFPDHILFDQKQKQGRHYSATADINSPTSQTIGPFALTNEELLALCLLINNNRLPNLTFSLSTPIPPSIDLSSFPNVGFTDHNNGLTLLF